MKMGWRDRRPPGPGRDHDSKNRRSERVRRERTVDTRVTAAVTSTATPHCHPSSQEVEVLRLPPPEHTHRGPLRQVIL